MNIKSLTGNQIKTIALIAMTLDHLICVIFPNYPAGWRIVGLHMIGRIAAPVFWFFVAEGYYHTRNFRKYAAKLFVFAIISHFAYNFAFGIPYIPFRTTVFNQTSVIWALFWGLIALAIQQHVSFKDWQKMLMIIGCTIVAFIADWSSIAVLGIMEIGAHRGDFKM